MCSRTFVIPRFATLLTSAIFFFYKNYYPHRELTHPHARPEPGRRRAVLACLAGPVAHHLRVDGAADAVVQFRVQLGQRVRCNKEKYVSEVTKWNEHSIKIACNKVVRVCDKLTKSRFRCRDNHFKRRVVS